MDLRSSSGPKNPLYESLVQQYIALQKSPVRAINHVPFSESWNIYQLIHNLLDCDLLVELEAEDLHMLLGCSSLKRTSP